MKTISLLLISLFVAACASKDKKESVDRNRYRAAIVHNKIHFANCYKELAGRSPEAQGKLVMSFTVNPESKVDNIVANKETSTLSDENFIGCMTDALKNVEFEPAPKGLLVDVKYPFVFLKPNKK